MRFLGAAGFYSNRQEIAIAHKFCQMVYPISSFHWWSVWNAFKKSIKKSLKIIGE